jgi:NTP pyrophosphatase (non-canonical NTP hydrolase)
MRTYNENSSEFMTIYGLVGEFGEAIEIAKKYFNHNKPLDRNALIDEFGDWLWYYVVECKIRLNHQLSDIDGKSDAWLHPNINANILAYQITFGAYCELVFDQAFIGKIDKNHSLAMLSKMDDILLIVLRIFRNLDITIDEVMQHNIDKLQKRYPSGFSYEKKN